MLQFSVCRWHVFVHLPYSPVGPKVVKIASWSPDGGLSLHSNNPLYPDKYSKFVWHKSCHTSYALCPYSTLLHLSIYINSLRIFSLRKFVVIVFIKQCRWMPAAMYCKNSEGIRSLYFTNRYTDSLNLLHFASQNAIGKNILLTIDWRCENFSRLCYKF